MADNRTEEQKYKDFHGRRVARVRKINIPLTPRTKLIYVGKSDAISYISNKWDGKTRAYIHTLKKRGHLFTNKAGTMWIIIGTKTNLKKEGIVG